MTAVEAINTSGWALAPMIIVECTDVVVIKLNAVCVFYVNDTKETSVLAQNLTHHLSQDAAVTAKRPKTWISGFKSA